VAALTVEQVFDLALINFEMGSSIATSVFCRQLLADYPGTDAAANLLSIIGSKATRSPGDTSKRFLFGDSHIGSLVDLQKPNYVPVYLGPVTMHGLGRAGLARLDFQHFSMRDGDCAVLLTGEIDVRCWIGKIRDTTGRAAAEVIATLVDAYIAMIAANRAQFAQIACVVVSVPPPVPVIRNPLVSLPSYGTLEDRIALTRQLNAALATACRSHAIGFADIHAAFAQPDGTLALDDADGSVHINFRHQARLNAIVDETARTVASAS
jgi:hypothetical protein